MIVGSNSTRHENGKTSPNFLLVGTVKDFEALHKQLALFLSNGKFDREVVLAPDGTFTFLVTAQSINST